tara:strand:- start:36874 stop:37779 length:906 start_codon:yes stop_codon:yes gene_type:complete
MSNDMPLLRKEEAPRKKGALNASPNWTLWESLFLWYQLALVDLGYTTPHTAIRFGLEKLTAPTVFGYLLPCEYNPADRSGAQDGTWRVSVYNKSITNEIIDVTNSAADRAVSTTVKLVEGVREVCNCDDPACFIHPTYGTGGGERTIGGGIKEGNCPGFPTGIFTKIGHIAADYYNKVRAGLEKEFKVPILGLRNGQLWVAGYRTLNKRSGNGKNPTKPVTYRYATTCLDILCGKKTCFGLCQADSHMRFAVLPHEKKGRVMFGIDPRAEDYAEIVKIISDSPGGVIQEEPYNGHLFGGDN